MTEDFDEAEVGALATPETTLPSDAEIDAKATAAREKAAQTLKLRESFFKTVRWALISILVASAVTMVLYLISEWGNVSPTVMISFNVAIVVDTIGLAYIVANYLFPRGGAD